ncbi:hypothetical protein, partial [Xylanibacter rodentium]|uniref:hypothetical protein n=1 Tax=Xylanibacter rodentium TaxID=2736289 RepID=UPI0025830A61
IPYLKRIMEQTPLYSVNILRSVSDGENGELAVPKHPLTYLKSVKRRIQAALFVPKTPFREPAAPFFLPVFTSVAGRPCRAKVPKTSSANAI